jgi:spermidine/putrescine transport system ATP-binding protein
LIAGFELPTSGEVWIDGRAVHDLPAFRRNVNTVFQSYSLFPHLNVFENVAFGLRRSKVAENEIRTRVQESLNLVQLGDFGPRRVQSLSGGQQQRVALARALVNRPAVLLLDEPMAALDAKLRKEMQWELKRLQKSLGVTFVLVTHDQEEALTLSDRLAVVHGGHLEQVGNPHEMYDLPATRFVAEFIGTANFLAGKITASENGHVALECSLGRFWASSRSGLKVGDKAELTFRPERCLVSAAGSAPVASESSRSNLLEGKVEQVLFLGPVTRFAVRLENGALFVAERATHDCQGVAEGEKVCLTWDAQAATVLAAEGVG